MESSRADVLEFAVPEDELDVIELEEDSAEELTFPLLELVESLDVLPELLDSSYSDEYSSSKKFESVVLFEALQAKKNAAKNKSDITNTAD